MQVNSSCFGAFVRLTTNLSHFTRAFFHKEKFLVNKSPEFSGVFSFTRNVLFKNLAGSETHEDHLLSVIECYFNG